MSNTDAILKLNKYIAEKASEAGYKLTTIYLVKLIYLADLFYAKSNQGKTFTGWSWYFHNFGPWTVDSLKSIHESANKGFIKKDTFASKYDSEDFSMLSPFEDHVDTQFEKEMEALLGFRVHLELKRVIKAYGGNTNSLLNYVYEQTEPMVHAVPGETLSFQGLAWPAIQQPKVVHGGVSRSISKKFHEAVASMVFEPKKRERLAKPIYDNIYFESLRSLTDEDVPEHQAVADVSSLLQNRKSMA